MSSDELQELQEHAEHAQHDPTLAPVSLTMAILAVLVAVVSLLGHRAHTEEVIRQAQASDQWAYYQAKNIRGHEDKIFADLTAIATSSNPEALAKVREEFLQESARYKDDENEIQGEARKLELEVVSERKRADRYDLGEVFLEIGLVVTSITLLSGRRMFWYLGLLMGIVGLAVAVTGFLVR
ncbi:MAG TPA: DUF4337 domain-containing protein [Terriglobales bacterium]|jgi:hypothetical protein|nr:DUF4337 domain-containing protein [Terriglobales bacterium]